MKISTGKYVDQFAIGVTWLRYPNVTWSVIFDFGLWYVEVSNEDMNYEPDLSRVFPNVVKCDRCGSPNRVYSNVKQDGDTWKFESVCYECLEFEEHQKNGTDSDEGTA